MVDSGYADDLKHELLTEMAENFFSRRRRLDERLEAFATLREEVARRGRLCLARWLALRTLLLDGETADRFLSHLGFDVERLVTFPTPHKEELGLRRSRALTPAARYRRTLLHSYKLLRRELVDYNEGGFAPDPRDRRRMRRIPGYDQLISEGQALNEEITAVNAGQCPSDMLQFTKALDPVRQEQESACGGIGCGAGLDRELAYAPLDLDALEAPPLPTPPPLDAVTEELSALAKRLYAASPQAARAALDLVTGE